MPNYDQEDYYSKYYSRSFLDSLLHLTERIWNNVVGLLPFPNCHSDDSKFGLRLGELKYSRDVFLRLASESPDFDQRADLIINYLIACNPHLENTIGPMDQETRRRFFTRLTDDHQFDWCFNKYPNLELADTHMQPGLSGLHVSDSVRRDKRNNKYVSSPLGALLVFLLFNSAPQGPGDPTSSAEMWKKAPPMDSSRPPHNGAAALGLSSHAANWIAQTSMYGVHESHEEYEHQKAKLQAERSARLLEHNADRVVSEHEKTLILESNHGKGTIKCISIEAQNSPSVETSETLRKLKSGETGCTSICGTQKEFAVKQCLKNSRKGEELDIKDPFNIVKRLKEKHDNDQCEDAGPFKSEVALKNYYKDIGRQGVWEHEAAWRRDQRQDPLFNGECKEPQDGNFNPWPGSSIDKVKEVENKLGFRYKKFASNGVDFNKGCKLESFPNPYAYEAGNAKISLVQLQNLKCEDDPGENLFAQNPFKPNRHVISTEELSSMLQEFRNSLLKECKEDPFKFE